MPAGARSARHLFTIWVPPDMRDEALRGLQERGIGVAVNYRAMHLLTYYAARVRFRPRAASPCAELIGDRTITLPLYPSMSDEDVAYVIAAVRDVAAGWESEARRIQLEESLG